MTGEPRDNAKLHEEVTRLLRQSERELSDTPPGDVQELVRELQMYQAELEEQNSELRRVQSELEASRDRYSDLYDFAPVGYLSVDADNCVVAANLAAAELFQVRRENLVGSFLQELVDPHFHEPMESHLQTARDTAHNGVCDVKLKIDGEAVYVRFLTDAVSNANAERPTLRIALTNITQERAAEIQQEQEARRSQLAKRHQTLGALAGGMASDIDQLLCPIVAHLAFATSELPLDSPVQEHLHQIRAAVELASGLTGSVLRYAGRAGGRFEHLSVNALLTDYANSPQSVYQWKVDCQSTALTSGDQAQLESAISQCAGLLSAPGGPQIGEIDITGRDVSLSDTELQHCLFGECASPGNFVAIQFANRSESSDAVTGHLRTVAKLSDEREFEHNQMAIVAEIIRKHRGAMQQTDDIEAAGITIYLPSVERHVTGPSIYRAEEVVENSGNVLLIDANEVSRKSTEAVLQSAGYTVTSTNPGTDALDSHREHYLTTDIVLLDYAAAELSALQTLVALKQIQQDVNIVLRLGPSRTLTLDELKRLGAIAAVRKPCSAFELTRKLKTVMQMDRQDR